MPLAAKAERANAVLGIRLRSVLEGAQRLDVAMEDAPDAEAQHSESDDEGALQIAQPAAKAPAEKGDAHGRHCENGTAPMLVTSYLT